MHITTRKVLFSGGKLPTDLNMSERLTLLMNVSDGQIFVKKFNIYDGPNLSKL